MLVILVFSQCTSLLLSKCFLDVPNRIVYINDVSLPLYNPSYPLIQSVCIRILMEACLCGPNGNRVSQTALLMALQLDASGTLNFLVNWQTMIAITQECLCVTKVTMISLQFK